MPVTGGCADTPRVAVIIPAYNAAGVIGRALMSIEAQKLRPAEVVVIDDGSTDGTCAVVKECLALTDLPIKLISQQNRGPSSARNAGIRSSSAEFISCLDADDEMLPHALETLSCLLLQDPEAVLSFGDAQRWEGQRLLNASYLGARIDAQSDIREGSLPRRLKDPKRLMVYGNFIAAGAFVFRRSALEKTGLFDEELWRAEDRLFFLRLALAGPWVFSFETVAKIHSTEGSLSDQKNACRHAEAALEALAKFERYAEGMEADFRSSIREAREQSVQAAIYWAHAEGPCRVIEVARKMPIAGPLHRHAWNVSKSFLSSLVSPHPRPGRPN